MAACAKEEHPPWPGDGLGNFTFAGDVPIGMIADFYGFLVPKEQNAQPVADFISCQLHGQPIVGDRIRFEAVELLVHHVHGGHITRVALGLDPSSALQPTLSQAL
jgi:cell volume regulation protein A